MPSALGGCRVQERNGFRGAVYRPHNQECVVVERKGFRLSLAYHEVSDVHASEHVVGISFGRLDDPTPV